MEDLGLSLQFSPHGAISFNEEISEEKYDLLKNNLRRFGMVLLNESESMLIDKIINTIVEIVHFSGRLPKLNFTV